MAPKDSKLQGEVTVLLQQMQGGDKEAREKLISAVYGELRKLAAAYFRRERQGHTLQPTALVNEAYLKLVGLKRIEWQNRAHFFGVVARLMRQILVDHARRRNAAKHGGGVVVVPADAAPILAKGRPIEILVLDQALDRLEEQHPRAAQVVEFRSFGGLSVKETAEVLDVSDRTVKKDWQLGRAFLRGQLGEKRFEESSVEST